MASTSEGALSRGRAGTTITVAEAPATAAAGSAGAEATAATTEAATATAAEATIATVVAIIAVALLHHRRRAFLELLDADGHEAEDVLVDAHLALHLGHGGRQGR